MKVILQQDVKGQGKKGQMIDASEGYARNYLLPRKLAIPATADAINTMNLKEKARRAEEARQKAAAAGVPTGLATAGFVLGIIGTACEVIGIICTIAAGAAAACALAGMM